MASDVKWIKIVTDVFDDEKILMIETMPECDTIIVIWFKLLCLAGKQNNGGVFQMGQLPYTDEMFAAIFRRPINTVRLALNTFERFGMIEIIRDTVTIPNWGKHQSLDAYEKKKQRDRERIARKRAEQKALLDKSPDMSPDKSPDVASLEEDIEEKGLTIIPLAAGFVNNRVKIEIGLCKGKKLFDKKNTLKEKDIDIITTSNDVVCATDVQNIVAAWNSLGLSQINKLVSGTKRHQMLKARIKEYGTASILEAIEKIKASDFLMGRTGDGWTITFDWFIRPNNFPKVLDGNYQNKSKSTGGGRKEIVPEWMERDSAMEDIRRMERDVERMRAQKQAGNTPELSERVEELKRRLQG